MYPATQPHAFQASADEVWQEAWAMPFRHPPRISSPKNKEIQICVFDAVALVAYGGGGENSEVINH